MLTSFDCMIALLAVSFFSLLSFFVYTSQEAVKDSNKITIECYKILKDKSASDLVITCGKIR